MSGILFVSEKCKHCLGLLNNSDGLDSFKIIDVADRHIDRRTAELVQELGIEGVPTLWVPQNNHLICGASDILKFLSKPSQNQAPMGDDNDSDEEFTSNHKARDVGLEVGSMPSNSKVDREMEKADMDAQVERMRNRYKIDTQKRKFIP